MQTRLTANQSARTILAFLCLSGKAQVQEVGGYAAEDQKQLNPNFQLVNKPPNDHPGSVRTNFYSLSFTSEE